MNPYKLLLYLGTILTAYVLCVYDYPPQSEDKRTVVRLLFSGPPDYSARFDAVLVEFERLHPHIKVVRQRAPGGYYVKVQTMMVGKTCTDVLAFTGKRVNAFKAKGTLLNLMPFIQRDGFDLDDFYEVGLRDAQMTDNELYYLPLEGSGTVLFYNQNAFDKVRLAYPTEEWTWDDFREAAIRLTKDFDNDGRPDQVGTSASWWYAWVLPWIYANGGKFVSDDQRECLLDRPEAIEAMDYLLDLDRKYHATTNALGGMASAGMYENFAASRVGMICDIAYALPNLMSAVKGKALRWNIALPPKGKCGRPIRYTSSGWAIWSGTRHPEEAWALVKFLSAREFMRDFCAATYYVPTRKSIGDSPEFLDRADTAYDERVLIASLKQARPLDNVYALRGIEHDMGVALSEALLGITPLKTAMAGVVERANRALQETAD